MDGLPLKGFNSCVTSTEKAKANLLRRLPWEDFYPAFLLLGSWLNDAAN